MSHRTRRGPALAAAALAVALTAAAGPAAADVDPAEEAWITARGIR